MDGLSFIVMVKILRPKKQIKKLKKYGCYVAKCSLKLEMDRQRRYKTET